MLTVGRLGVRTRCFPVVLGGMYFISAFSVQQEMRDHFESYDSECHD